MYSRSECNHNLGRGGKHGSGAAVSKEGVRAYWMAYCQQLRYGQIASTRVSLQSVTSAPLLRPSEQSWAISPCAEKLRTARRKRLDIVAILEL